MRTIYKIWLDTDIGNDIDDSAALAYLLKKPECELVGISTVSGQSIARAKLTDVICRAGGKSIPIYPGLEEPLLTPQRQGEPHQIKFLDGFTYTENYPTGCAIEAMYKALLQNPGQITLLAIGPMTNVAMLFKLHPDAVALVKEVVLMCGEFFGKSRYQRCENEWNAYCDPYAAAILYRIAGLSVRSVGLDVTSHLVLKRDTVKARFASPLLKTVYDFGGFETGERAEITFHDPLAAVSIFKPEIMQYETGRVHVELQSSRVMGRTYFDKVPEERHTVAYSVDAEAFYQEFFSVTA